MSMGSRGEVGRRLRTLWDGGATGTLDDADLLGRFLRRDETAESAFVALVERYGRMVAGVCGDILGDPHDAQDAAQATFLILARQAGAIRRPEALPGWLHGTARRVASRALRDSIRRRRHERRSVEMGAGRVDPDQEEAATWPELHEEIDRLPDRYRAPIVLCDLSGLTHEQAAAKLGCPPRTLQTRLYRGRERLKARLIRRGVAPAGFVSCSSPAIAPPAWVDSMAAAAVRVAGNAGWSAAGEVRAVAAGLARSELKGMAMTKLRSIIAAGLLVGIALGGAWSGLARGLEGPRQGPAETPRSAPASPKADPVPPKPGTHPITVTGRAVDPEGKPVADARITLASRVTYGKVAETTTDADGRYEFRDAPLPIKRADTNFGRDEGAFQVFGQADGLGFTWRPIKWFYPEPKPTNITHEPYLFDQPSRYERGDKIVLDLRFSRAARVVGAVVDDRGKPLANVRLKIYDCVVPGFVDNCFECWSLDILNYAISDAMSVRTTDASGRFEFSDMPENCRFRIILRAKDFPDRTIYAATSAGPQPEYQGATVLTGDFRVAMTTAVAVAVRMVYGDTGKPAAKVAVQAAGEDVNTLKTSDEDGLAILHLPPGHYRMENLPARGTPYLLSGGELDVTATPPAGPVVARLDPAAFVEISVVDAETGRGIADVDVWRSDKADGPRERYIFRSWEVATRTAWV